LRKKKTKALDIAKVKKKDYTTKRYPDARDMRKSTILVKKKKEKIE